MKKIGMKPLSSLDRAECIVHLIVYPLILVPLGIWFMIEGPLWLGIVIAASPYLILLELVEIKK